jgi:hypothetical protein
MLLISLIIRLSSGISFELIGETLFIAIFVSYLK